MSVSSTKAKPTMAIEMREMAETILRPNPCIDTMISNRALISVQVAGPEPFPCPIPWKGLSNLFDVP